MFDLGPGAVLKKHSFNIYDITDSYILKISFDKYISVFKAKHWSWFISKSLPLLKTVRQTYLLFETDLLSIIRSKQNKN